jgi:hypothetical protein
MANYCSCNIVVSGEEVDIKRLFDKLNSEELKGKNLYLDNYQLLFDSVDENYEWGSKWQIIDSMELDGDTLYLYGDSAWNPANGLWEKISKDYNATVSCEYSESGCDFAGKTIWENGEETFREEDSYLNYIYKSDTDLFWDEIGYICEYESIDYVIERLGDVYNNFSQSEIDKLNETHSQNFCGDENE